MTLVIDKRLQPGTRVMIAREHLRNTGQYTGPPAPCHTGPFAKGEIVTIDDTYLGKGTVVANVKWDDGQTRHILPCNLHPVGIPELV